MKYLPLFDNIEQKFAKQESIHGKLSMNEKNRANLVKEINNINIPGKELIYIIIIAYSVKYDNNQDNYYPYSNDTDLTWNISDIPEKLQIYIDMFCEMHKNKMSSPKRTEFKIME